MAQDKIDPTDFQGWPSGLDNIAPDYGLPTGTLRNAVNVDIFDSGKVRRRKGFQQVLEGVDVHSLWATEEDSGLYVEGDELKLLQYISGSWQSSTLDTGFTGRRVWYLNLNDVTYYSNGVKSGIFYDQAIHEWGVENPASAPIIAGSTGTMLAGTYQVLVSFLTAYGEESGTSTSTAYTLAADGGLFISGIAQPVGTEVTSIRIYCTMPDGDVFYRVAEVPVGMTSYLLAGVYPGIVAKTQFMQKFPPCTQLEYWNGRIYGVSGTYVFYTEPLRYGLYTPDKNFLPYPVSVNLVKSVLDGIYIAADKTFFVKMDQDGETPTQLEVLPYGAVPGTAGTLTRSTDVYWFSVNGMVVGGNGGVVKNVTQDHIAVDEYEEGSAMYREKDGVAQVVYSLSGKGNTSAFTCSDYAEAEIIRRKRV